jgi:hypothetical protein
VVKQAQAEAQRQLLEQMEDSNKAQAIVQLKEKLLLMEHESTARATELAELRALVAKKDDDLVGLENRLVEAGEMRESEREELESARSLEAAKSAEQQKATEEATRMASVLQAEQARLVEEYGKMQKEMDERAQAAAKRFLNLMMNRTLAHAFAKLRLYAEKRKFFGGKWADFVEYQQGQLSMKLRKVRHCGHMHALAHLLLSSELMDLL